MEEQPTSQPETTSPAQPAASPAETPVPTPAPAQAATATITAAQGGLNGPMPDELKHWNWGAFFLHWIWGVGHNVWISLLMFVPVVQIAMPFVLGAKGNEWAWQHRKYESVAQFKEVEHKWMLWGIGIFVAQIVFFFLLWGAIIAFIASLAIFGGNSSSSSSDSTGTSTNSSSIYSQ